MDFVRFEKGELKNIVLPTINGYTEAPLTTIDYAYSTVPWLYRGVTLIAQAVSSIPWSIEDQSGNPIEDDIRLEPISDMMGTMLYLAALSRTLYGAAYFVAESNRFNLKTTPRYIPAPCVVPRFTTASPEIIEYTLNLSGRSATVPADRVLRSWRPNPFSEVTPGVAPAYVALQSAGMLSALDQMATAYFKRGAVPLTAVIVPQTATDDDKKKLEGWFERFAGGIRNSLKFLAIRQGTEFKQIGANVKDTQAFELTESQRDNVAVALGVPPTVLDGKSANYATANSEMMGFYLHTVIPEAEQIAEHFTKTFFAKFGLQMCIEEEKLEIMQSMQLEQAAALMELTGGKAVFTVDEARDWLGMDPMTPAQAESVAPPPPPQFGQPPQAGSAPQAGSVAQEPEPDPETAMRSWRDAALVMVKGGSAPIVGTPFDDELKAASSAGMVRRVFEAHWPKPQPISLQDAVKELARYNALASREA